MTGGVSGALTQPAGRISLPADRPALGRQPIPWARNLVQRPRVNEQFRAASQSPIVLISAPAGSGKSMSTASWLAASGDEHAAWVSLKPIENNVHVFWRSMAAAIIEVSSDSTRPYLYALAGNAANTAEEAPMRLARWVAEGGDPIVLVLDNLHEISNLDVHTGLLQFLSQAPPGLRTIVVTRSDPPWPLHQLQLEGKLTELNAADLAFNADEAAAMFAEMGATVSPDQLTTLLARTEGWAAGVRLAALGVRNASDSAQFIDEFSGDEHSVADYLMHEVFDRLPPDQQDFLLRISTVDEVCGDLADALTGRRDGAARLVELAEANTFVHTLGRGGEWYRLHPLLVDFLNGRLTDPLVRRDLDRRAAGWFQSRAMPWNALRHALKGADWELAADLASRYVLEWVSYQSPGELEELLDPLPLEVLLVHPGLAIGRAATRVMVANLTDVEMLTDAVRAKLPQLSGPLRARLEALADAVEMAQFRVRGDLERTLEACRRVPTDPLDLAPLGMESWDVLRTIAMSNMGTCELWQGELAAARKHLDLALTGGRSQGLSFPRINARAHTSLLAWIAGELVDAEEAASVAVADCATAGTTLAPQVFTGYLTLAAVALDRDDLETVDRWLDLAQDTAIEPHAVISLGALRALRLAAGGRLDEGIAAIRAARQAVASAPVPHGLADLALLTEADLRRQAGDRAQSLEVAATVDNPGQWEAVRYRVHCALDAGEPPNDDPAAWPEPTNLRTSVEQHVLAARCALAAGDEEGALTRLEAALAAAAPQDMRQVFLLEGAALAPLLTTRVERGTHVPEFTVGLLNRMTGRAIPAQRARSAIVVPLTERELVMLRYLASALSNAEISRALYVTLNTVKTHQRMIYRKLAVNDRRDAVARGHELGLL